MNAEVATIYIPFISGHLSLDHPIADKFRNLLNRKHLSKYFVKTIERILSLR